MMCFLRSNILCSAKLLINSILVKSQPVNGRIKSVNGNKVSFLIFKNNNKICYKITIEFISD